METKEIQKLIDFIAQSGLDEVNIETSELKIKVKRYGAGPAAAPAPAPVATQAAAPVLPQAPTAAATSASSAAPAAADSEANYITIKSPMIGTFYRAASPETPSLVNIGDEVKPGKPVCVIEAMKLFNEIESEVAGRIVKVLVENATPVEFDQPLFLVEPV